MPFEERGDTYMSVGVKNFNVIDFKEALKPSQLEKQYIELYGQEFVNDLKHAYYWMKRDMQKHLPSDRIVRQREQTHHKIGDWVSVFYVDFRNEDFYSQTIDDMGGKTIYNYGHSPCLGTEKDHNIRYLLSGLYFYDKNKTRKWLKELLGEGEKFWFEKV